MLRAGCRGGALVFAVIALGALAGCASIDRGRVARLSDGLHDDHLRKISSVSELDELVQNGQKLAQLRDRIELRHRCRKYPSGPERPWQCDKHRETGEDTTLDRIEVTGSRISPADLITNNQEAGVDEGDIVKKSGEYVIVLRNGVLHSIRIQKRNAPVLELVDSLKVAVDDTGRDVWYDEILTYGKRLILLGFNYGQDDDVAELLLFDLDADGRFHREGRYWLRSEDYFTSDNYGARIQGGNLLLSMSLQLDLQGEMAWPEWSRRDAMQPAWTPLVDVEELYFPIYTTQRPYVHVLLQCPIEGLGRAGFDCRTTGIIGAGSSVLYASDTAAYLALPAWDEAAYLDPEFEPSPWHPDDETDTEQFRHTAVFRVPFAAGGSPAFARVDGRLDNQFNFKQHSDGLYVATHDGAPPQLHLNVTDIRSADFKQAVDTLVSPKISLPLAQLQSTVRFSETSVWVGPNRYDLREAGQQATAVDLVVQPLTGGLPTTIHLPHSVDSLQPAFNGMIVSGMTGGDAWRRSTDEMWSVSFASEASAAQLRSTMDLPLHVSAEERSHAFNMGMVSNGVQLFGMPGWPKAAMNPGRWNSEVVSDLVFMRLDGSVIRSAGTVSMQDAPASDDCEDDCYDWYGNARLFFVGDRVFALSANLLKEARYRAGMVSEVRRVELP